MVHDFLNIPQSLVHIFYKTSELISGDIIWHMKGLLLQERNGVLLVVGGKMEIPVLPYMKIVSFSCIYLIHF